MIRAGIAGHGLVAADEDAEDDDARDDQDGSDSQEEGGEGEQGEEEEESGATSRRAVRVMSKAMGGKQCGVGLVLESWKPRGLAHALNLVARTNEAVRVDQLVPDGPADHAIPRMEKGDILKEIDGVSVVSLAHAKELILGPPGSMVLLLPAPAPAPRSPLPLAAWLPASCDPCTPSCCVPRAKGAGSAAA
jgi:C-terminal processing protease CtpA/Prc